MVSYLVYDAPLPVLISSLGILIQSSWISCDHLDPGEAFITDDVHTHFLVTEVLLHIEGLHHTLRSLHQEQLVHNAAEVDQIAAVDVFLLQATKVFWVLELL